MLVGVNKREWVPMAMKRKLTGIAHYNRREKKTETVESFWLQSGMHAFWLNNKLTHIISHPKQSYFILKEIYDFFVPIFKSTRYIENRFTRYIYTNAHTHRIPRRSFLKRQPSDCWGICVAEPRPPCWRRLFLHLAFFFVSEKKSTFLSSDFYKNDAFGMSCLFIMSWCCMHAPSCRLCHSIRLSFKMITIFQELNDCTKYVQFTKSSGIIFFTVSSIIILLP